MGKNINWERRRGPRDDAPWRRMMVDERRRPRPRDVPKTPLKPAAKPGKEQVADGHHQ